MSGRKNQLLGTVTLPIFSMHQEREETVRKLERMVQLGLLRRSEDKERIIYERTDKKIYGWR